MILFENFVKSMDRLAKAFQNRPSSERIEIYYERLKFLFEDSFNKAIDVLIDTEKSFPTIARIREEAFCQKTSLTSDQYPPIEVKITHDKPYIIVRDDVTGQYFDQIVQHGYLDTLKRICIYTAQWQECRTAKAEIPPCMQYACEMISHPVCSDDEQWQCFKKEPAFRQFKQCQEKAAKDDKKLEKKKLSMFDDIPF